MLCEKSFLICVGKFSACKSLKLPMKFFSSKIKLYYMKQITFLIFLKKIGLVTFLIEIFHRAHWYWNDKFLYYFERVFINDLIFCYWTWCIFAIISFDHDLSSLKLDLFHIESNLSQLSTIAVSSFLHFFFLECIRIYMTIILDTIVSQLRNNFLELIRYASFFVAKWRVEKWMNLLFGITFME